MCYPVTVTDAHTQCPTGGLHTELMAESSALSFFFPWCGPFLKFLMNLLQYHLCFMFWLFGNKACRILAPQQAIKSIPPALEGEVLTAVPPGKSLECCLRILPPHWGKASSVSYSPSTVHRLLSWGHPDPNPSVASQTTLSQQLGLALNWVIWLFAACLPARVGAPMHFSDLDCLSPQSLFQKRQGLWSPGREGRGLWRNAFRCSPLAALGTGGFSLGVGPAVTAGAGVPGASCGDASVKQLLGVGRTPLGLTELPWSWAKDLGPLTLLERGCEGCGPSVHESHQSWGAPSQEEQWGRGQRDGDWNRPRGASLTEECHRRARVASFSVIYRLSGDASWAPEVVGGLRSPRRGVGAPSTGASAPLLPCTSWASVTCPVLL